MAYWNTIALIFLFFPAFGFCGTIINPFWSAGEAPATPDASYALDAAGGGGSAQLYDSIAETWKGGGADTVTFSSGYLISDTTSDRAYVPGTDLYYSDVVTITFTYQVDTTNDANLIVLNYNSGGDYITFKHYNSTGIGRCAFRSNYGTEVQFNFDNTGLSADTDIDVVIILDFAGNDGYLYIDGSLKDSEIDNANIVDPVALSANAYVGYVNSGTNTIRMKNLKIYNASVSP